MLAGMTARPLGDLLHHELRGDVVGDFGAEVLAVARHGEHGLAAQVLADGDELHLGRDDPAPGVVELGDADARLGAAHGGQVGELGHEVGGGDAAVVLRLHLAALDDLGIAARDHPGVAGAGEALFDVDDGGGVGVGARRVVDGDGRFVGGGVQRHLAEGHADVRVDHAGHVDLAAAGDGAGGHAAGGDEGGFNGGVHGVAASFGQKRVTAEWNRQRWRRGRRCSSPFAGMTRIRFGGFAAGRAASQPLKGLPGEREDDRPGRGPRSTHCASHPFRLARTCSGHPSSVGGLERIWMGPRNKSGGGDSRR